MSGTFYIKKELVGRLAFLKLREMKVLAHNKTSMLSINGYWDR